MVGRRSLRAGLLLCAAIAGQGGSAVEWSGAPGLSWSVGGTASAQTVLAWSARYMPWLVFQQRRLPRRVITGEPSRALRLLKATLPEMDRVFLEQSEVAEMILSALREGYRQGPRGPAQDDVITRQRWGFDLRKIGVRIDIWQGGQDLNVPRHAAEYLRATLPITRSSFLPQAGHFSLLQHCNEMLTRLVE